MIAMATQVDQIAPLPDLSLIVRDIGVLGVATGIVEQCLHRNHQMATSGLNDVLQKTAVTAEDSLPSLPGPASIKAAYGPHIRTRVLGCLAALLVPAQRRLGRSM